jgi:hypothetical protein
LLQVDPLLFFFFFFSFAAAAAAIRKLPKAFSYFMFLSSCLFPQALGAINFLASNSYTVTRDQRGNTHSFRKTECFRTKIVQILLPAGLVISSEQGYPNGVRCPHVGKLVVIMRAVSLFLNSQSMC